jgi:hypothetical protein
MARLGLGDRSQLTKEVRQMKSFIRTGVGAVIWCGVSQCALASLITFTGSATGHSASAVFSLSGTVLDITLSNTYANGATFQFVQTDVLEGLFFDVAGTPALAKVYAKVAAGSAIKLNGLDITASETSGRPLGVGDVGAAWAYKSGTLAGLTQRYGLGAAGFSIFGPTNLFEPGGSLPHQQGTPPAGADYGLMPLLTTNYSHDHFSTSPFVQNSVTFELSGFTKALSDISNVRFQYGTATTECSMPGVPSGFGAPEPSVGAMTFIAAIAVGLWWRRKGQR